MKNTRRTLMAATALLGLWLINAAQAQIYVANFNSGMIDGGTIGEYNLDGSTVNASLVTGLTEPVDLAVSGGDIFVANYGSDTIGEYTTAGATVNASLVTGLSGPYSLAVSGGDIFVANSGSGTIGEYTTAGATVNASLVSGLDVPCGLAVSGGNIFVANKVLGIGPGTIGEYTTAGATVNASLVTGLLDPFGIDVEEVPEPSTWPLLAGGLAGWLLWRCRASRALI